MALCAMERKYMHREERQTALTVEVAIMAMALRTAIYLRVSRDSQTTENQRIVLSRLAERRGFEIVHQYEDQGISGGKGRDRRPAFNQMLKDAMRRRFDVCLVWSMDRLGRSVLLMSHRRWRNPMPPGSR